MAEVGIGAVGVALVTTAILANQRWLDRHFLPSFLFPRFWYVLIESAVRSAMAVAGLLALVVLRPRVGRFVASDPARLLRIAIAAALALAVSEPVVARIYRQPAQWLDVDREPLRRADARLGWTFVPGRASRATVAGRAIEYAIDGSGYRVANVKEAVDFERPTVLLTGESVMFGHGLTWDESIAGQVAALTHVQTANLAVNGYGSDQAFLRLQAEWPRFRRPVAVVSLFMPALLGRNLNNDRPHLGPGLVWLPPVHEWRLQALTRLIVPYHSARVIERGIAVTREVLRATVEMARARAATALIVVPEFGDEASPEQTLRRRVIDDSLPYVLVQVDPAWRLSWDRHPDARGAHAIAAAIAEGLVVRSNPSSSVWRR